MRPVDLRTYPGPNVYSLHPVCRLELDIGPWENRSTRTLPEFCARLLALFPGLSDHTCSRGYPGGFTERLQEGTYLGHVVEHVALELQRLAGVDGRFGKTRRADRPGHYYVVISSPALWAGEEALLAALDAVEALLAGEAGPRSAEPPADAAPAGRAPAPPPQPEPSLDRLREQLLLRLSQAVERYRLGPSGAAVAQAAAQRGIPVTRLERDSDLLQLGYGQHAVWVCGSLTERDSTLATDLVQDKARCQAWLQRHFLPVPSSRVVQDEGEAVAAARRLGWPVVVKPADGHQGQGVSLNVQDEEQVRGAFRAAAAFSRAGTSGPRVLVEQQLEGHDYRLLVVGGRLVAASRRHPAGVRGNGIHSVRELVAQANADPRRGPGHDRPLTWIQLDATAEAVLAAQGLRPDSVPPAGRWVRLRDNANLSSGGTAEDVTGQVHPRNAQLASMAARVCGLDVAGVDVVARDISQPLGPANGAIIEVNASPGLRMHLFPSGGPSRPVGDALVEHLFPRGSDGRIPIVAITGTNGKTTVARLVAYLLSLCGGGVGLACSDGIYLDGELLCEGDNTGPDSARVLLGDRRVRTAVLEVARGGLIQGGLGYDRSQVGVVLDVQADHLGQFGVRTLDDLAQVKSVLAETVLPAGRVVLNADDPRVAAMAERASAPIVFFSTRADHPLVQRHCQEGGTAVYADPEGGTVWVRRGGKTHLLLAVRSIGLLLGGWAVHNLPNALAAAAAAVALRLPLAAIRRGLRQFSCSEQHNPGRFNFIPVGQAWVLVDYGHNPDGLRAVLSSLARLRLPAQAAEGGEARKALKAEAGVGPLARRARAAGVLTWPPRRFRRMLGVIAAPGDRLDVAIEELGFVAGSFFDRLVIKEDADRRGRAPLEVPRLLARGASRAGMLPDQWEIVADEGRAVWRALEQAQPGDLVAVFYEKHAVVRRALAEWRASRRGRQAQRPGRPAGAGAPLAAPAAAATTSRLGIGAGAGPAAHGRDYGGEWNN
ncbi:MAG: cyanophycin synthetase [Firmicutes bacterium]|nr:cyanophycin synthetase [Bacillota bacterium]